MSLLSKTLTFSAAAALAMTSLAVTPAAAENSVIPGPVNGYGSTSASCDVNGDGVLDYITGSYWFTEQQAAVYLGPVTAASTPIVFTPGGSSFNMGINVACDGDLNGDGLADMLFTSQAESATIVFGAANLQGGALSEIGAAGVRLNGYQILKAFPVGDLTGDGRAEFAIVTANAVYLYDRLPESGQFDPQQATKIVTGGSHTVLAAAAAGDVNGDGKQDLVLGSPNSSQGGQFAGAAYVLTTVPLSAGSELNLQQGFSGFTVLGPESGNALLGTSVAGIGDINGDGFADLLLGAPGDENVQGAERPGGAAVVLGSAAADTVSTTPQATGAPSVSDAAAVPRGWWLTGLSAGDHLGENMVAAVRTGGTTQLLLGAMDGVIGDAPEKSGYAVVLDAQVLLENGVNALPWSLQEMAAVDPRVQVFHSIVAEARFGRSFAALAASAEQLQLVVAAPANFSQLGTEPQLHMLQLQVQQPAVATLQVSAGAAAVGDTVTVTATGLQPGAAADFSLHSDPLALGTVTADAAGTAELSFTVPAGAAVGQHELRVIQKVGLTTREANVAFTVQAAAVPPATGEVTAPAGGAATQPTAEKAATAHNAKVADKAPLAITGNGNQALVWVIAAVVILGGGAAVVIGRRMRR